MTAAKLHKLSALGLALNLALTATAGPALGLDEDIDEVRPHGFTSGMRFGSKRTQGENWHEMELSSPEQAKKMADTMKLALDKQHQKYDYKQEGFTHTVFVTSTKKTMVFTAASPDAAKKELRKSQALAELFPQNEQIASLLSRMYENERNWSKALEYYRKANSLSNPNTLENIVADLDTKPAAKEARQQAHYAYFELMMKHYETAIRMLTKAIQLQPEYLTAYSNRGKAYRALHKDDLAAKDEKKLNELTQKERQNTLSTQPGRESTFMALFLIETNALEEALRSAEAILKKEPNSASALLAQARANLRLGRYAKALADYKKLESLTKSPACLKAEMAPAAIYAKQGPQPYGDITAIIDGRQTKPEQHHGLHRHGDFIPPAPPRKLAADHKGDYRVYIAICLGLKEKSLTKALDAELNKVLALVPDDTLAIENKIEATEAMRDWPSCEKYSNLYLQQLTQGQNGPINTDFVPYAFTARALARRAQKNLAGAIEDDTAAIKLAPESALAYRDRGDCYRLSGKYDLALADYTKAIQLDSTKSSSNYWRRAKAYEKLNNANLAKQDLEMAKKLDLAQSKI